MIKSLCYGPDQKLSTDIKLAQFKSMLAREENLLWLDVENPTKEELELLKTEFKLHPLTIEDCVNTNARPKIEKFTDYMFLILHSAGVQPRANKIKTLELNICIGKNFILTIHIDPIPSINSNWDRCQKNAQLLSKGSDSLLHHIIDSLVDNYFPLMDVLDSKIEKIEQAVFKKPTQETLSRIFSVKKELLFLRRFVAPQREIVNLLSKDQHILIRSFIQVYFRDVFDNLLFIQEAIDTYRDSISSALDAHLSTISNKTNDIMKTLTIIATIAMPLTLITGIYGMNFKHMPELNWPFGYLGAYILMCAIAIGMLVYFKIKKWF